MPPNKHVLKAFTQFFSSKIQLFRSLYSFYQARLIPTKIFFIYEEAKLLQLHKTHQYDNLSITCIAITKAMK
jgi:hypothetical protein